MVVVDTNILAYLLLEGDRTIESRSLFEADPDWRSDVFVLIEFMNVLATTMRTRGLTMTRAEGALAQAQTLIAPGLHEASYTDVLALAVQFKISAYDARFLAVANRLGVKLVTEDVRLRKAAPKLTQTLEDALATA